MQGFQLDARLEMPDTPVENWAVIAHCFGGSKDVLATSRVSKRLAEKGFGVLRFDFMGLGDSEGHFANSTFSSNIEDILSACQYLDINFQPPTLLFGHSLGGALVLEAAARLPKIQAVATLNAPSDPGHVTHLFADQVDTIQDQGAAFFDLAGKTLQIKKSFLTDLTTHNLLHTVRKLEKKILVFHSRHDGIVPISHGESLFREAQGAKAFWTLDNSDHMLNRQEDAYFIADILHFWVKAT